MNTRGCGPHDDFADEHRAARHRAVAARPIPNRMTTSEVEIETVAA